MLSTKDTEYCTQKGLLHISYFMFFLLLYWMRYSVYFSRLMVRRGPFCSIFPFCTWIYPTWQWSDDWPKHVAGSNKLNVQKFGCCVCVCVCVCVCALNCYWPLRTAGWWCPNIKWFM